MKIVYDEYYGELSYSLRAAIRKYNVSPADYAQLEYLLVREEYESDEAWFDAATFYIKSINYSPVSDASDRV